MRMLDDGSHMEQGQKDTRVHPVVDEERPAAARVSTETGTGVSALYPANTENECHKTSGKRVRSDRIGGGEGFAHVEASIAAVRAENASISHKEEEGLASSEICAQQVDQSERKKIPPLQGSEKKRPRFSTGSANGAATKTEDGDDRSSPCTSPQYNEKRCRTLCQHYLEPRVRTDASLPGGMTLRRQRNVCDLERYGKRSSGRMALLKRMKMLQRRRDDAEIFRPLSLLWEYEMTACLYLGGDQDFPLDLRVELQQHRRLASKGTRRKRRR
mmetsp:Transcript_40866/g.123170  ORF Transcript_40866/g.123170 Transcript_40866/m.123170 type:complete len:272 (-) Transcript_40866:271-1086(-)